MAKKQTEVVNEMNEMVEAGLVAVTPETEVVNESLEVKLEDMLAKANVIVYKNKTNSKSENAPDLFGILKIGGQQIKLSFWKKTSKQGVTYYNGVKALKQN